MLEPPCTDQFKSRTRRCARAQSSSVRLPSPLPLLTISNGVHPKLRYTAGVRASRLRLLRRFAPVGIVDAGIRKMLKLDAIAAIAKEDLAWPQTSNA
jgi:hypothetical protein